VLSKLNCATRNRKSTSTPGWSIGVTRTPTAQHVFSRPLQKDAIASKQEEWRPVPLSYLEPDIPVADLNVDFSTIAGVNGSE